MTVRRRVEARKALIFLSETLGAVPSIDLLLLQDLQPGILQDDLVGMLLPPGDKVVRSLLLVLRKRRLR